AADHGHAPGSKDRRLREPNAGPIAFEESGDAHPLGMIATETGMDAIDTLETVGEPRGGQSIRSQPPPEVGERPCDRRQSDADQGESCQRAGVAHLPLYLGAGKPALRVFETIQVSSSCTWDGGGRRDVTSA